MGYNRCLQKLLLFKFLWIKLSSCITLMSCWPHASVEFDNFSSIIFSKFKVLCSRDSPMSIFENMKIIPYVHKIYCNTHLSPYSTCQSMCFILDQKDNSLSFVWEHNERLHPLIMKMRTFGLTTFIGGIFFFCYMLISRFNCDFVNDCCQ